MRAKSVPGNIPVSSDMNEPKILQLEAVCNTDQQTHNDGLCGEICNTGHQVQSRKVFLQTALSRLWMWVEWRSWAGTHIVLDMTMKKTVKKEGNVLFNDTLNTFYLRLYGVRCKEPVRQRERKPVVVILW